MSVTSVPQEKAPAVLNVPVAARANYAKNFIRQAVCELRFPTLYELEGDRPPASFSKALRASYPIQEMGETLRMGGSQVSRSNVHVFKSKKKHWSVTLRASSVTLETANYTSYDEFKTRLAELLQAVKPVIDADFFTRIGLRYINAVPFKIDEIDKWVNPALVAPLSQGIYGDPIDHGGRVAGRTAVGGFLFQHGVNGDALEKQEYSLDFDLFAEDVAFDDALETTQKLHDLEFSMFRWSLGPAALENLGPSKI